jgi:DNA-binding transcriptional MerR regulator
VKGPEAFRSISEASDALGVPQHVLRFWETKFSFIRPMKRAGGRRFYRPQDIVVLAEVRRLLHEEGYTIKGVQKLHRELGAKRFTAGDLPEPGAEPPSEPTPPDAPAADAPSPTVLDETARRRLTEALETLEAVKARLDALLGGD